MKFLDDIRKTYEEKVYGNANEMQFKRNNAQVIIAPARQYELPIAAIVALATLYRTDALNAGLAGGLCLVALSVLAGAKFLDFAQEAIAATSSVRYVMQQR